MNCVEYIMFFLEKSGISHVFSNPGTTEINFIHALNKTNIKQQLCLSEGAMAGMLDGYFRASNKPCVSIMHMGIGLCNALAYLHNAKKANSHLLNIIGDNCSYNKKNDFPLQYDIETALKSLEQKYLIIDSEDSLNKLPGFLKEFISNKGIYSVVLSLDFQEKEIVHNTLDNFKLSRKDKDDSAKIDDLIFNLKNFNKVAFILDIDGEKFFKKYKCIESIENLDLFCKTFPSKIYRGKDYINLRKLPYFSFELKNTLKDYSKIYYLGQQLMYPNFVYDSDKEEIEKIYSNIVKIDPNTKNIENLFSKLNLISDSKAIKKEILFLDDAFTIMNISKVIASNIMENMCVIDESNTSGGLIYYFSEFSNNHQIYTLTGGAIGHGIPMATGACIGNGNKRVLCLQSDGSALYNLEALWSQAHYNLNITTILFVNNKYNIISMEYMNRFPSDKNLGFFNITFPDIKWDSLGIGFGIDSVCVNNISDLKKVLPKKLKDKGPNMIILNV